MTNQAVNILESEYSGNAQQDTQRDRNEKADAHWRRTLPKRQSQRLVSSQRHDAIREAAKLAALASVQADIDSVVHTDACCRIRQHFSQQQEQQGRQPHQGGSQEQWQQQQNSEAPAPAAATAVRSQDKAVRYVGLAATSEGSCAASAVCPVMFGAWCRKPGHAPRSHLCSRRPSLRTSFFGPSTT